MAIVKWYHFLPVVGQVALVAEIVDQGFDKQTAEANDIFTVSERPSNINELKQRLKLEIEAYERKINLNKKESSISNIFGFVYSRGVEIVLPRVGEVFLQIYSKLNESNLSLKEREIIEWLNAVQVRIGVSSLIDNPNIRFSFDVYDTKTYPANAEVLRQSIFEPSNSFEEETKPQQTQSLNWWIVGGALVIGGVLIFVIIRRA